MTIKHNKLKYGKLKEKPLTCLIFVFFNVCSVCVCVHWNAQRLCFPVAFSHISSVTFLSLLSSPSTQQLESFPKFSSSSFHYTNVLLTLSPEHLHSPTRAPLYCLCFWDYFILLIKSEYSELGFTNKAEFQEFFLLRLDDLKSHIF